jgi:hypothetical protein
MSIIPTEDEECLALVQWLDLHRYRYQHSGNESGQSGTPNIIRMMAKKKRMGVSPGHPDYTIYLKNRHTLYIEMKRKRKVLKNGTLGASPSTISDVQQSWIDYLDTMI